MSRRGPARREFPWERWWLPLGEVGGLVDPDGFCLADRLPRVARRGGGGSLGDLPRTSLTLLLGEAGLGKSWEVERFAGAAGDRRLVRLGGVGPDAYAAIRTREWFAPWRDGADELTLVLDGLNEAPGGAPKALLDLLDDLPAGARRRLGLVLTCRTAAAPGYGTLLDGLACRLGAGEPGSTWVLLPLTREDVSAAARELGLDLDALWLELAGAGPLAARPRTLLLLLDELEANGTLPGSVGALYEEGCRRLAAPAEDESDGTGT